MTTVKDLFDGASIGYRPTAHDIDALALPPRGKRIALEAVELIDGLRRRGRLADARQVARSTAAELAGLEQPPPAEDLDALTPEELAARITQRPI